MKPRFSSLVVLTIGENDEFRKKARFPYLSLEIPLLSLLEVKIKSLPRKHSPLNELEIPPPPPVTITSEAEGAGGAVYMAEPATVVDSEDNHNDGGECRDLDH